jgi:hypothetical protein
VLRFYGYDLDGTSNMLTESRVDGDEGGMANATEATESPAPTTTTTATVSSTVETETSDDDGGATEEATPADDDTATTIEASGADGEGEEEETTVAPTRKRRGRLGRGLKSKQRRERKPPLAAVIVKSGPTMSRRSRSYYVLLDEDYENGFNFQAPSPTPPVTSVVSSTHHHHHHHHHHHEEPSTTAMPVSTGNPSLSSPPPAAAVDGKYRNSNHKDLFDNVNSDSVEHIFYLNEYDTVRVPYKLYDTVMKYAYVGPLQASFLEIDLDSEYYNLMVIVPDHIDGLSRLTDNLQKNHANSLRHIRNTMEFFWVKTIVPKFSLKGNTILTGDLQNVSVEAAPIVLHLNFNSFQMGINDIFEPTKADFSLMAEDKSLYVKNIEQMININIRTQSTQQLKSEYREINAIEEKKPLSAWLHTADYLTRQPLD